MGLDHMDVTVSRLTLHNNDGTVGLQCRGNIDGPRWLDGRTADRTVALAPNRNAPFSGTRWEVIEIGPDDLRCPGTIEGSRMLDGRTQKRQRRPRTEHQCAVHRHEMAGEILSCLHRRALR
jgi:hypothetical protein